jgi:TonB family protein
MGDLERDIARYRNGEMTPAEMHALEMRALNDPFLEEALEGITSVSTESVEQDLKELRNRLMARVAQKPPKVIAFWVWPARIAAGLLMIVVAAVVIIRLSDKSQPETLAVNKELPLPEEKKAPQLATPPEADRKDVEVPGQNADPPKQEQSTVAPAPSKIDEDDAPQDVATSNPDAAGEARSEPEQLKEETADFLAAKEVAEETIERTKPAENATTQPTAPKTARFRLEDSKTKKAATGAAVESTAGYIAPAPTVITGVVRGDDGEGLPGVNITIKDSNIGTVTDAEGHYQLSVVKPATLVYSFIGFTSKEIDSGNLNQIDVTLDQDMLQLSEVVVTGYGAQRETDNPTFSNLEFAYPEGGHRAYKQYLENNLRYPEEAVQSNIEGKVTIQFTVETTGQLSDFNVIKGLGHGCDDEVIRLIKAGPGWSPTRRGDKVMPDKVKVRMKFALPVKK